MLKNMAAGEKKNHSDLSSLFNSPGYYVLDEDDKPFGELFDKKTFNKLTNDLSSILDGDTTIPRNEQDEDKNLYKVIVGENILIQEIRTPAGIQRRIIKKDENSDFKTALQADANTNTPFDSYTLYTQKKQLSEQKQLRSRGIQNNEISLRDKCREYFRSARGATAPWNDSGPNVIYDDTDIKNQINSKVPVERKDELVPRNGSVLLQGHTISKGLFSRNQSIFFHWYNHSGLPSVLTIYPDGSISRLVGIWDGGSSRRVLLGDTSRRMHIFAPGHERASVYNAGRFHEPILVRSDMNWKRAIEPGPNENEWSGAIGQDFFEAWGYVHGGDGGLGGNNMQAQIIRGHSGSWVGISAYVEVEYVLNYDGGAGFNTIGSSKGYTSEINHGGGRHSGRGGDNDTGDDTDYSVTYRINTGACGIRALFYRDFR